MKTYILFALKISSVIDIDWILYRLNTIAIAKIMLILLKGGRRSRRRNICTSCNSCCCTDTVRSSASPCHILAKSYWRDSENWNC